MLNLRAVLLKGNPRANIKQEPNFSEVSKSYLSGATNDEFSHENERTENQISGVSDVTYTTHKPAVAQTQWVANSQLIDNFLAHKTTTTTVSSTQIPDQSADNHSTNKSSETACKRK